jgi:hypothetical protein
MVRMSFQLIYQYEVRQNRKYIFPHTVRLTFEKPKWKLIQYSIKKKEKLREYAPQFNKDYLNCG